MVPDVLFYSMVIKRQRLCPFILCRVDNWRTHTEEVLRRRHREIDHALCFPRVQQSSEFLQNI